MNIWDQDIKAVEEAIATIERLRDKVLEVEMLRRADAQIAIHIGS